MSMPAQAVLTGDRPGRARNGHFLPGTSGNPRGQGSRGTQLLYALMETLEQEHPGAAGRSKAQCISKLLVDRSIWELQDRESKGIPCTELVFSKLIPQPVAVKLIGDGFGSEPVLPAVLDVKAMAEPDRVALIQIAQRYALARDVPAETPAGGEHGQAEEGQPGG